MGQESARFDCQARTYDRRAALAGVGDGRAAARSLISVAGLRANDVVLDVGAGTGQIARWFRQEPVCYVAIDLSRHMLDVLRRTLNPWPPMWLLVRADAERTWPVADARVNLVLSSRSIHLLTAEHVIDEVFRVMHRQGGVFVIGRVQHRESSLRGRAKSEMRRRLHERGWSILDGEDNRATLLDGCVSRGASRLKPLVVARWRASITPKWMLESWEGKPGLAGLNIPERIKRQVLEELAGWAQETYGALDRLVSSEEAYVFHGVRLWPQASG